MATCPSIRVPWRHLANTIELVHSSAHLSPQPIRQIIIIIIIIIGSVQLFLHSLRQKVPILYNGRPSPPELPLPTGDLDLPCNTWCFWPMRIHNPNGTSIGSAVFAQMTAECLYTLQWFACFPLKIAPSHVGIWTSFNKWFIGPTRVRNTNCNLIVSAVFAGLTKDRATERPRDHATQCDAM